MENKKTKYLYFGLGLLAIIVFYFGQGEYSKRKLVTEREEYPFVSEYNNEYIGKIVKRSMSAVWQNTYLFQLNSGDKFTTRGMGSLQVGDSVYKAKNSDSLFVFTKDGEFSFNVKYNNK